MSAHNFAKSTGGGNSSNIAKNLASLGAFAVVALAALLPFCAMADGDASEPKHGYWTGFSWFDGDWMNVNKWVDGYIPTNSTDVMHFQKQDDPAYLYNAWMTWPKQDWTFGTLADSSAKTVFRLVSGYGHYYYFDEQQPGSRALWVAETALGGFGTRNAGTSHVNRVVGHTIVGVNTVGADHTMLVDELSGLGTIEKVGPGTLVLANKVRGGLRLVEGRVTLGQPDPENAYVSGAALHLDAAATNTLTWAMTNGVRRLTKWEDADGTGIYATAPYVGSGCDWLGPFASPYVVNGVSLIDFGGFTKIGTAQDTRTPGDKEAFGAGCAMNLSNYLTDKVKEVFYAFSYTSTNVVSSPLAYWSAGGNKAAFSVSGNRLFKSDEELQHNGVSRLNGAPFANHPNYGDYRDGHALSVVSGALTNGNTASIWHVGGNFGDKTAGGMRVAEAFAYTNTLTDAQRRQNNAYLLRKWHDRTVTDLYPWDLDYIQLKGANAELNVDEGCVARVRTVHAPLDDTAGATNLVKVGGGTLELDRVSTNAIVVVRGGRVKYVRETAKIAADPQPAIWPFFHCDATRSDTFIFEKDGEGNDTTNILAWKDVRADVDITMTNHTTKTTAKAFYSADGGPRGKPCVDFGGIKNTADGARLGLSPFIKADGSPSYTTKMMDGFIVWRNKGTKDDAPWIFSDYAAASFWRTKKSLATFGRADVKQDSAMWRVDGRFMNQENEFYGMGVDDWVVVRIHSSLPMYANALAGFRDQNGGGIQVGEFIMYDRPLGDFEGRQTEAYLLKKWKNMSHPDESEDFSGSIVFGAGVSNVLDIASDRTFTGITCSGAFVKDGAGRAKTGALTGATSLAVEDGAVNVVGDWPLPAAVKFACNVVTSETACVTATGTLTIPPNGVLEVVSGDVQPEMGLYTVASADAISGSFSGWRVVSDVSGRAMRVRISGNDVVVSVASLGMMIMVR